MQFVFYHGDWLDTAMLPWIGNIKEMQRNAARLSMSSFVRHASICIIMHSKAVDCIAVVRSTALSGKYVALRAVHQQAQCHCLRSLPPSAASIYIEDLKNVNIYARIVDLIDLEQYGQQYQYCSTQQGKQQASNPTRAVVSMNPPVVTPCNRQTERNSGYKK
jgi:hypothetical protein